MKTQKFQSGIPSIPTTDEPHCKRRLPIVLSNGKQGGFRCESWREWSWLTATLLIATSSVALSATFHLSHVLAPDDPVNVAALRFADVVKEKTQGRVEIKVHPASSLSGLKDGAEGGGHHH